MTLFKLQEWLGHASPSATQHYAKITPLKLAKSYADAGYFARNLRAIEVLIDQDAVRTGLAPADSWKFYDLGHGYCTYDFFEQCPHRMACAKCDFYLPKRAVVETSAGNFQAWLKHPAVFPKLIGTFVAQTLAARYDADPSAADWRRFGRLPGFTNCKPKYKRPDGLFPFVQLRSHSGEQYPKAQSFEQEITKLYQAREQGREARRLQASLSPQRGPRFSLSLERFRTSSKYNDRPAAADIAFCVAAYSNGMDETRIERALEDDYLSRDPSPSKRTAYIRGTMKKERNWASR